MNANEKRIFKAFLRFLKENKLMKTLIIYTISIHFLYKLLWNGKIVTNFNE